MNQAKEEALLSDMEDLERDNISLSFDNEELEAKIQELKLTLKYKVFNLWAIIAFVVIVELIGH